MTHTSPTIIIGVDDTIKRRKGNKVKAKGCYRDPVRSTEKHVIRRFGLKWLCMMLIVSVVGIPGVSVIGHCLF